MRERAPAAARGSAAPQASLSVLDGVAILVGIVVGIGIFKTPALVAANVASGAELMGLWLLGGAMTLVGALVYAELGAACPSTGGEYTFLSRALGRPVGVMFAWARMTVIQTGAIAAVAFVFGDYAAELFSFGPLSGPVYAGLAILVLTGVNLAGAAPSTRTQIAFTIATVVTIGFIAAVGFLGSPAPEAAAAPRAAASGSAGLALIFILLTYGGWNEAAYLSAELRDVQRSMLRVLVFGTAAVVLIYLVVNAAYLHLLGLPGMRGSPAVAADFMRRALGEPGVIVLAVAVACAALSTLNGTIYTGARVYHAVGRDLPDLAVLGIWDPAAQKPTTGLLVQGAISLVLVIFGAVSRGGFQAMVEYTAPVFWFFLFLVGVSLFVLRRREPERHRPFRVPLYPVTPALFCLTCAYLFYSSVAYTGLGALAGTAVLLAGLPLLLLVRRAPEAGGAE